MLSIWKIFFLDRKKDLVKLRHGEYVALGKVEACLKTSILCDNVCVFADQQELSCVAIAVANPVQIGRLCAQLGLKLEIEDACKNKQIIEKVFETFREAAKTGKLHKQEIPSKIYLISEQWTPESGFVTDALKLKRLVRENCYREFVVVKHLQQPSQHSFKKARVRLIKLIIWHKSIFL